MHPSSDAENEHRSIDHDHEPFVRLTLSALTPPLLWVVHFAIVYLLEGFLCTRVTAPMWVIPGTISAVTVVCGGACGWMMFSNDGWLRRAGGSALQSARFLTQIRRLFAGLAMAAIVWSGTGAIFLSPCSFSY